MRRFGWALSFVVLMSAFAPPASAVTSQEAAARAELFSQINAFRAGLGNVSEDAFINDVAYGHSRKMARRGSISHAGFSKRFSTIVANDVGVTAMCENVAYVSGISGAKRAARRIFKGWKNSPPHKQCMLNGAGFTADDAGIGVKKSGGRWYATYIAVNDTT